MIWSSGDPANKFGLAIWEDDRLICTRVLKAHGSKGKYKVNEAVFPSKWQAFIGALNYSQKLFVEDGFGHFRNADKSQARYQGYVEAVMHSLGGQLTRVNLKEWRRVIKEEFSISWPSGRENCKRLSVQLVKRAHNIDVTDDEADAVLLGHAVLRMGMVLDDPPLLDTEADASRGEEREVTKAEWCKQFTMKG